SAVAERHVGTLAARAATVIAAREHRLFAELACHAAAELERDVLFAQPRRADASIRAGGPARVVAAVAAIDDITGHGCLLRGPASASGAPRVNPRSAARRWSAHAHSITTARRLSVGARLRYLLPSWPTASSPISSPTISYAPSGARTTRPKSSASR